MRSEHPKELQEQLSRRIQEGEVEKQQTRDHVVTSATHIVDALNGNVPGVEVGHYSPQDFTPAPSEVPTLDWDQELPVGESEVYILGVAGDVGGYYADRFPDTLPSVAFNSGFYAGVLAVKAGLVDPEAFAARTQSAPQDPSTES